MRRPQIRPNGTWAWWGSNTCGRVENRMLATAMPTIEFSSISFVASKNERKDVTCGEDIHGTTDDAFHTRKICKSTSPVQTAWAIIRRIRTIPPKSKPCRWSPSFASCNFVVFVLID